MVDYHNDVALLLNTVRSARLLMAVRLKQNLQTRKKEEQLYPSKRINLHSVDTTEKERKKERQIEKRTFRFTKSFFVKKPNGIIVESREWETMGQLAMIRDISV